MNYSCTDEDKSLTTEIALYPDGLYLNNQWVSKESCNSEMGRINSFGASVYSFRFTTDQGDYTGNCNYAECTVQEPQNGEYELKIESGRIWIKSSSGKINGILSVESLIFGKGYYEFIDSTREYLVLGMTENVL